MFIMLFWFITLILLISANLIFTTIGFAVYYTIIRIWNISNIYNITNLNMIGGNKVIMKFIKTINCAVLSNSTLNGGCGECQASCQSACKSSCTTANQKCEKK